MKEITMEKIEALQNNEEFTSQMAAAKTMDDVLKTMNDNGIELTKEAVSFIPKDGGGLGIRREIKKG